MSTPSSPVKAKASPLVPPDERFWQRYSAHHEMPLSAVGSFALHALIAGGLLLFSVYLASFLFKSNTTLPVEIVRLDVDGTGLPGPAGGSGNEGGPLEFGDAPGTESAEAGKVTGIFDTPRPPLRLAQKEAIREALAPPDARWLLEHETKAVRDNWGGSVAEARKLSEALSRSSQGTGGAGKDKDKGGRDGGKDGGTDKGLGKGTGSGKGGATLSQREKRMLRWHMKFPAQSGQEYVQQLRSLGATLAFPLGGGRYKVIDLTKNNVPEDKTEQDLAGQGLIYWTDRSPDAVRDVTTVFGLQSIRGDRFIAFMPRALEQKLFDLEKEEWEKRRLGPFNEARIYETTFRVEPRQANRVRLVTLQLNPFARQ